MFFPELPRLCMEECADISVFSCCTRGLHTWWGGNFDFNWVITFGRYSTNANLFYVFLTFELNI